MHAISRRRQRLLRILDNETKRRAHQYSGRGSEDAADTIEAFSGMEPNRQPIGQWKRYKHSVEARWASEGFPLMRLVRSCTPWRRR